MKDAYKMYVKECHEKKVPVRVYDAFCKKRRRMVNE